MGTSTSQQRLPIAVILCRPEISRNIGAVCRAMANNNCADLRIVGNKKDYEEEQRLRKLSKKLKAEFGDNIITDFENIGKKEKTVITTSFSKDFLD